MHPPKELKTDKWREAYHMFYEALSEGRTISSFEHSLKNARDSFDSHIPESNRKGWKNERGKARKLEKQAEDIFRIYSQYSRSEIWNLIKVHVDTDVSELKNIMDDLISIEESETEKEVPSKTEGGKKVIISYRYERSPSLRKAAFKIHGYDCAVCGFNYGKTYGSLGKDFAEVHHISLLSANGEIITDPKTDLVVLCANCHRMIHRKRKVTLTVLELKKKLTR